MGYAIKELQEKKAQKVVKYPFLTSISDYISKEYADIKEELLQDETAIKEVLSELIKDSNLVYVDDQNRIGLFTIDGRQGFSVYIKTRKTEDKGKEKYINVIGGMRFNPVYNWTDSYINAEGLDSFYYINDEDAYANHVISVFKEEEKEEIERIQKRTEEKSTNLKELVTDAKRFGVSLLNKNEVTSLRNVEKVAGKDADLKEAAKAIESLARETVNRW